MREIKFRGYNKETKKWYYGMLDKFDGKYFINDGTGTKPFVEEESIGQYTGIKDRDGKEIYEGDILKEDNGEILSIEFYDGAFVMINHPVCYAFSMDDESYNITELAEVIGNIYEEKLKEDK